jgi:hypothetical protein
VQALVAFGMQLGAIAAITGYTCTQEDSDGFLELDQTATSTDGEFSKSVSGRRLLGTPSASEFKARCSYYYGATARAPSRGPPAALLLPS